LTPLVSKDNYKDNYKDKYIKTKKVKYKDKYKGKDKYKYKDKYKNKYQYKYKDKDKDMTKPGWADVAEVDFACCWSLPLLGTILLWMSRKYAC